MKNRRRMYARPGSSLTQLVQILDALQAPAMVAVDAVRSQIHVNDAFCDLIGRDRGAIATSPVRFFENGRLLRGDEDPLARSLFGNVVTEATLEVERSDGSLRTIVVNALPLRDDKDAIVGAFAVLHDSEQRVPGVLREISANTPALLFTADPTGKVDSVNARWTSFIGTGAGELLGSGWTQFVHAEDLTRVVDDWSRHLVSGESYVSQWRFRRADGTYRWTEIRAEAQRDVQGNIQRWFGSGTDVDAQRRAIDALEFLSQSGATVAGAQDVAAVLDRLARAALEGLADISIFDLEEEDGNFRRLVVASPDVPQSAVEITLAFDAPKRDEPHPIARAMASCETIHVPYVDDAFIKRSVTPPARQDAWRFVDIRSIVCAPMMTSGRSIGAVTLLRTGTSVPFDAPDVKVIEEVARRAAVTIENIRLKGREERAAQDLQAFADMGASLSESLGLEATLDAAMRVIVPSRADWAYINLVDEQDELRLSAVYHPDAQQRDRVARHLGELYTRPDGDLLPPSVTRTQAPVFRERLDEAESARNVNGPVLDALLSVGITSIVVVPLLAGSVSRGTIHLCMQTDARRFANYDVDFFTEFARRLAPAIANAELFERERRVARSFQEAALPALLPDDPHFVFRAIYEAGRTEALVGGDWYDAFSLTNGSIVVSMGDVAGSGLSAAVTMAGVRQAIRGAAHVNADPSVMLEAADRAVSDDPEKRFVTAFVGVIDPAASTITYQSAGHPPPMLRSADGTITELLARGTPLGLRLEHEPQKHRCTLPAGSLLVLYTDGLTESTHDILEGEQRLRAALADPAVYACEDPAQMLHDTILAEGSRDDVAILTISVR
jgi:PAS domain S-box-containing protein